MARVILYLSSFILYTLYFIQPAKLSWSLKRASWIKRKSNANLKLFHKSFPSNLSSWSETSEQRGTYYSLGALFHRYKERNFREKLEIWQVCLDTPTQSWPQQANTSLDKHQKLNLTQTTTLAGRFKLGRMSEKHLKFNCNFVEKWSSSRVSHWQSHSRSRSLPMEMEMAMQTVQCVTSKVAEMESSICISLSLSTLANQTLSSSIYVYLCICLDERESFRDCWSWS